MSPGEDARPPRTSKLCAKSGLQLRGLLRGQRALNDAPTLRAADASIPWAPVNPNGDSLNASKLRDLVVSWLFFSF